MEFTIIGLIVVTIAIYAMIDISQRRLKTQTRIIWFSIVVLIPFIGPLFYFLIRRSLT